MAKNIYICGNPLVDDDSMPFRILKDLKAEFPEINFLDFDPTENFPDDDPLFIIDTVMGIDEVKVIEDVDNFEDAPHLSAHDADLAFHLKMLKKLERLPRVVIFGVPVSGDERELVDQLCFNLPRWLTGKVG